ncbi:MAG: DnaJ C-terminal domain-containing protein [Planctomycetota bacterium]
MSVRFKDYYEVLGVRREASDDQIRKAFRDLARKFHPDVNKDDTAQEKFKEINEAYEVLKDPEKRSRYDQLGANWQAGQEFQAPPGFDDFGFHFGGPGGGGSGGFSDFFSMLFGQGGMGGAGSPFESHGRRAAAPRRDVEAELELSVEDLVRGGPQSFTLEDQGGGRRTLEVKIPKGSKPGAKMRLKGQGQLGPDGQRSDLILKLALGSDSKYQIDGFDLRVDVPVSPWEIALGARVDVRTPDGEVALAIPAGSAAGHVLRLRGLGLPKSESERGDLLAKLRVVVPSEWTNEQKKLLEKLRDKSKFNPRE